MKLEKLRKYQKEIFDLQHCINVIGWDLRISTPRDEKEEVVALISGLEDKLFKLQTNNDYEILLKGAIESDEFKELSLSEQRYINNLLKNYYKKVNVPNDFYIEYTEFLHKSTIVWEDAKKNNDYNVFKPYLEKVIELTKKYYSYINFNGDLYDVMLNEYEAGLTSHDIDKLFSELKEKILPIIPKEGGLTSFIKINCPSSCFSR